MRINEGASYVLMEVLFLIEGSLFLMQLTEQNGGYYDNNR
ncbi:hypothetical protein BACI71_70701 [Bacillus mycoides]|uniref:Uncharacterized protein n=1 Tax=Bacillus mycoides TaxID=1405 RepID=A0A654BSL1_BACMY|nr:hypothetical protein BACI71_70701 [Bacillus mycoides]